MFIEGFNLRSAEEELDFRKEIKRKLLLKCDSLARNNSLTTTLLSGFSPLQARRCVMGLAMSL